MFSQGQLVFAGGFFVVFVVAMMYAYRKDSNLHRVFYKGNYKIKKSYRVKWYIYWRIHANRSSI